MPDIVETAISKNPPLQKIYDSLVTELKKLGSVQIEPKKTSVHVMAKSALAGIHPRKEYLVIQIVSDKPIANKRIFKVEQVSKNRFHNHLRISGREDINGELKGWLKRAYKIMS